MQQTKRRKVERTTFNERGEEVTEYVWEEYEEAEVPSVGNVGGGEAGGQLADVNDAKSLSKSRAPKVAPKLETTRAKDSAQVEHNKPNSKKAPAKGQKGIMSFFGKK